MHRAPPSEPGRSFVPNETTFCNTYNVIFRHERQFPRSTMVNILNLQVRSITVGNIWRRWITPHSHLTPSITFQSGMRFSLYMAWRLSCCGEYDPFLILMLHRFSYVNSLKFVHFFCVLKVDSARLCGSSWDSSITIYAKFDGRW